MGAKESCAALPSWIQWVGIIVVALLVFKVVTWVLATVVSLLFNVLLFAAIVAAVIYLVRKFLPASTGSK